MPVGTGTSTQQGMLSISETKTKRGGGGGGGAKQLLFLSSKTPLLLRRYELGYCHVEDGHV